MSIGSRLVSMGNDGDCGWRRRNAEPLYGLTFERRPYHSPLAGDRAFCQGCLAAFTEIDAPSVLHEGYVAAVRIGEDERERWTNTAKANGWAVHVALEQGYELIWLCGSCFDEFRGCLNLRRGP